MNYKTNIKLINLFFLIAIFSCRPPLPNYKIFHNTEYTYSKPVSLSDQVIRLHTFENDDRIITCSLITKSEDFTVKPDLDKYNQQIWVAHIGAKTNHFRIVTCLVLDTSKLFAHDYKYSLSLYKDLPDSFLRIDSFDAAMYSFLKSNALKEAANEEELLHACNNVYQQIEYAIHEEPGIYSAGELLKRGTGSCRDMNWFLAQYLRSQHIKSRVVSGYLINWETKTVDFHLWVEAKSSEGKWVGLDATSGSFTGAFHIPLSIGENPNEVSPFEGFSEPCEVKLNYELKLIKE